MKKGGQRPPTTCCMKFGSFVDPEKLHVKKNYVISQSINQPMGQPITQTVHSDE